MGQDAGMEHVRIGHHHMALFANGLAGVIGGVAVIGEGLDVRFQFRNKAGYFMHLILGQGLGGKEIKGPCFRTFQDLL